MKVYLVKIEQGEWSNYYQEIDEVFMTKEKAINHIKTIQRTMDPYHWNSSHTVYKTSSISNKCYSIQEFVLK